MEFNDVLNRRYSCRAFAAGGVEQEKGDREKAARDGGNNGEPQLIMVVHEPEEGEPDA